MKIVFPALVLLFGLGAFACSDEASAPLTMPEVAASPSPAAVVTPVPPLALPTILPPLPVPGWAVFHRGRDLWVGQLDGSDVRSLTQDALGSGFAGEARDAAGNRTLYFTALTEVIGTDPVIEAGIVDVYRQALDGATAAELVTTIRVPLRSSTPFQFAGKDVAVSPTGDRLAFADTHGLSVVDLASNSPTQLIASESQCDPTGGGPCGRYREPSWSFDSSLIAVAERHYEGSAALILDPRASATRVGPTSDGSGGLWREWDTRSLRLCASQGGYQSFSAGILNADGGFQDLGAELQQRGELAAEVGPIIACAWSPAGDLALQYWRDDRGYDQPILVLSRHLQVQATIDAPLQHGLTAWLPDSPGFIVTYGDGEGTPKSRLLVLDGSVHELALTTDDVVAVLPE